MPTKLWLWPTLTPSAIVVIPDRLTELKSRLAQRADLSLARLVERVAFRPFLLTEEEHTALSEVVRERGLDVIAILRTVDVGSRTAAPTSKG